MGNDQQKELKQQAPGSGASVKSQLQATTPVDARLSVTFNTNASVSDNGTKTLSKSEFVGKLFSAAPDVGELLYEVAFMSPLSAQKGIDLTEFVPRGREVLTLAMDTSQMQFYFNMFSRGTGVANLADVNCMLRACQRLSWLCVGLTSVSLDAPSAAASDNNAVVDAVTAAVSRFLVGSENSVSLDVFSSRCQQCCPRLFKDLHSYICIRLGSETTDDKLTVSDLIQHCRSPHSAVGLSTVWLCSCVLPNSFFPDTSGPSHFAPSHLVKLSHPLGWHELYSSNVRGLSMNRFQHHILDYDAPTLMFISFEQLLYAVSMDTAWKESQQRWGGGDCMFLQLLPEFRVIQSGAGMLYFNTLDRTLPKGIHIGREPRTTFLKLDEELSKANHYGVDYKLVSIEVWGCGGRAKLDAQQQHKDWEKKEVDRHKNRKLVPEEWKENADRKILELAGVKTDHAERGDL